MTDKDKIAELERTIKSLQLKLNTNGCDSVTDYMQYLKERDKVEKLKKTYKKQRNKRIDELQKENKQLKKEISVLLSCKGCTENKGGYICKKEYNDKCLAQKIEYIKELEAQIEKMKNCQNCKNRYPETKKDYIFCAECPKLDETKDNIILTKWEPAE